MNKTQPIALHEKLIVAHLIKNFPVIYVTRRFITVFTRTRHNAFWASCI
jgi:hypothetical protein